jgi:hypothetical protein
MPKILNTQLFKAVLDANASEHGARMTAMDKAERECQRAAKISEDILQPCKAGGHYNRINRNSQRCCRITGLVTPMVMREVS